MTPDQRAEIILSTLAAANPKPTTELAYRNGYELVVAVSLSAQCTDKRVNQVTPAFFERFPDPETLSKASVEEIFSFIKSVSFPNNKSKHLKGMAEKLMADYGGKIPESILDLESLPGVGRKTANVVASVLFHIPAMPVDTHVFRVAHRTGLADGKTPLIVEKQLTGIIPASRLADAHHWLILHGRYVCKARNPDCSTCIIRDYCQYFEKNSQ